MENENEQLPFEHENPNGLHQKYYVQKIQRMTGDRYMLREVDPQAMYYVLRLDENGSDLKHVQASRIALNVYAKLMEQSYPKLAKDIQESFPMDSFDFARFLKEVTF